MIKNHTNINVIFTFKEISLTEHDCFMPGSGDKESMHTADEGQSPQEQPIEESPHE